MFDWTYEELPQPTTDLATLNANIDEFGYCLVADAISPEQIAIAKARLLEQAQAELEGGHAFEDGGAKQQWGMFTDDEGRVRREAFSAEAGGVNQRVWMLINKGRIWGELLRQPTIRAVVSHVLGADYLLSSYGANIAKPGGVAMNLHTDQWWMPEPIHRAPNPVPAGSLTRELSNRVDDHPAMIAPPVVVNVMWMLNDFHGRNRRHPHRAAQPPLRPPPGTRKRTRMSSAFRPKAPAGTAMLLRRANLAWHGGQRQRAAAAGRLDHLRRAAIPHAGQLHDGDRARGGGRGRRRICWRCWASRSGTLMAGWRARWRGISSRGERSLGELRPEA